MLRSFKLNGYGQPTGQFADYYDTNLKTVLAVLNENGFQVEQVTEVMAYAVSEEGGRFLLKQL